MPGVGQTVIYRAPLDVTQGNKMVLARVGPGTESAAIVTAVGPDGAISNIRVFPDQQSDFSLRDISETENPVWGTIVALPTGAPAGEGVTSKTRTK